MSRRRWRGRYTMRSRSEHSLLTAVIHRSQFTVPSIQNKLAAGMFRSKFSWQWRQRPLNCKFTPANLSAPQPDWVDITRLYLTSHKSVQDIPKVGPGWGLQDWLDKMRGCLDQQAHKRVLCVRDSSTKRMLVFWYSCMVIVSGAWDVSCHYSRALFAPIGESFWWR